MKSSARNQFLGTVVAVRTGPVDFEVALELDDHQQIHSVITRESAESLGIQLGSELYALVKSHSVLVFTDKSLKLSARNQLWGEVVRLHRGPVNTEVVLVLPGGKSLSTNSPAYAELNRTMESLNSLLRELKPVARSVSEQPNALIFDSGANADPQPRKAQ